MIKSLKSAWFGLFGVERGTVTSSASGAYVRRAERYPTHTRVVLPNGQLMNVRNASLAAAKDLLAAQRAAEQRMAGRVSR
jgi:hypothetical protein